jgi:antitoxin component YwqK of YwqJK toxin-antitoxin module
MKKNKSIALLIGMVVMSSCLAHSGEIKKSPVNKDELIAKSVKNADNTITMIFYSGDKEVARQTRDRKDTIVKTTGKIPDGLIKEYYESGNLKEEMNFKNGKREGISRWYYESGVLKGERNFKEGELDGIIKWYYDTGSLGTEFNYKKGKLEGLTKLYWENGNLKAEHYYENGKREGLNKQYYNSGELRFIYTFKNGRRISKETYDRSGNLTSKINY